MLEISGYRISDKIYESFRHLVYRAVRQRDDLPVVLKVLRNEYPDPEETAAFEREYRITQSFEGQGSIRAYGLEKLRHTLFMALEDFGGESLTCLAQDRNSGGFWCRSGFYDLPTFLSLALQITDCLGLIHDQNIVHKDINPDNIVYNPQSKQLKIIDFGISSELPEENPKIRTPQVLKGNLAYISPEQTGRINRALDYRSDFYSLGVTLYRLLTGELPFTNADPLERVHNHIAREPESPLKVIRNATELKQELAENLQIISGIILKLLAKDAEERYQSAFGLKHDLHRCLQELKTEGKISKFEIASRDIPEHLCIPEKLYGRENELEILHQAFERISRGQCEMLLVKGYSGMGKSSLVEELRGQLSQRQAYFICGKFDQLQRDKPYLALIEAVRDMARQILTESSEHFVLWQTELQNALGQSAGVICEVIPEVEQIIGPQAAVPELPPEENRNRFRYLFSKFISVLARPGQPLVLFLDDLQWADLASLQLLEFFLGSQPEHLLLIGTFRDNVIEPGHPLLLTLENLRQDGMNPQKATNIDEEPEGLKNLPRIGTITLQPLGLEDIKSLLTKTLKTDRQKVHSLAELCLEKTAGNPFFLNQFIRTLYQEKLIHFERQRGYWEWETGKISELKIADNVIDLLTRKIGSLSSPAVDVLKHAACIGNTFDLQILSLILEESRQMVSRLLWETLQQGLLKSQEESYRLAGSANPVFCFLHDRVQKAAYLLIAQDKRNRLHLKIGRLLLKNLDMNERKERVFDLVNQFNPALDLITEESERETLAGLNLLAGKRAKDSSAYKPAEEYLQNGLALLSEASWQTSYELTLDLHNQAVQVAFLNADYRQIEDLAESVRQNARCELDKMHVFETLILAAHAKNELLQSLEIGLQAAALLGYPLPAQPGKVRSVLAFFKTKFLLRGKKKEELLNLPLMTDPVELAFMRIVSIFATSAYKFAPELLPVLVHKCLTQTVKHGLVKESSAFFTIYGLILSSTGGNLPDSYKFGELGFELTKRFDYQELQTSIAYIYNYAFRHLKFPLRESLGPLLENRQKALEAGNFTYSAYSSLIYSVYLLLSGEELGPVEEEMHTCSKAISRINQNLVLTMQQMALQSVQNLSGKANNPCLLQGEIYDEQHSLADLLQSGDKTALFELYFLKTWLCYLFAEPEKALENARETEAYMQAVAGFYAVPVFYFYHSLALLECIGQVSSFKKATLRRKLSRNQRKLYKWIAVCPENNLHKWKLVEAGRAALGKNTEKAMDLYEQAVQGARENGFLQDQALGLELAGRFYAEKGQEFISRTYLIEARYSYQKWGAQAKVKHLEQNYPWLKSAFTSLLKDQTQEALLSNQSSPQISGTSSDVQIMDFNAVIKALRTISGEIVLKNLLRKMLHMVMANSGASKGVLLLENMEKWYVEAWIDAKEQEVRIEESEICLSGENPNGPAAKSPARQVSTGEQNLPKSLLQYILRTRQQVLVNDTGQENKFSQDPYLADGIPKSMLGLPILSGGKLIGVLYLENDLATDVFTPERLQVLQLLASQTAISIQNAKLYGQLENLVQERTHELTEANLKLEKLTVTDSLTGVYNRLKFDEFMAGELKRSRRYKRPCSAILIDLDDFKLINDNLGHLAGDKVLQELSLILQENIRETDFLCRWGGEEFAILCPETDQDKVMELAEKIRKLVAEHDFKCQRRISISLGVTTLQTEDSRQSMFDRADRALYKSKSQGKNTCNFM